MSRRRVRRLLARAALGLAALALTAGCVGLPSQGPVQTEPIQEQVEDEAPVDFTPGGPQPGAAPVEIVRGFLVAMQATPISTSVARRFLTSESSDSWVPERGTLVYDDELRRMRGTDVRLDLSDVVRLDGRGAWLGGGGSRTFTVDMALEKGEWRISDPPNRLIIPTSHFETRFAQRYLYFFDKSAQVLVPEPVYVPTGAQASTFLVAGLLRGPEQRLLGVERTFIPARTRLDDISVPVGRDGTVEVPLSDEVLDVDQSQLSLIYAQLAWTLRQVPGVDRLRITVDGSPLDLPGAGSDLAVTDWSEFDPALSWASEALFGVRQGRVTVRTGSQERRVSGPFGVLDLEPQRIGVDLAGEEVAATTPQGRVLVGSVNSESGTEPAPEDVEAVYQGGTDLLAPVWDLSRRLWVLDRTEDGAELTVIGPSGARTLAVPGLTGRDVRALTLSRDGTRLAAVVSVADGQRVVLARVLRNPDGRVRRVQRAWEVALGGAEVGTVRDVAWRSPGTLAVLVAPYSGASQVLVAKVDGSSTSTEASGGAEIFRGDARTVVASPQTDAPLYLTTNTQQLFSLAASGRWVSAGIREGLRGPTFVG